MGLPLQVKLRAKTHYNLFYNERIMYIKATGSTIEQYPYSPAQLRRDNPNTSFPANMSDDQWATFGAYAVVETDQPDADVVTEGTPEKIAGVWTQQWESRSFTTEEVQAQLAGLQQSIVDSTQAHLDTTARDHGYDGILSACSYTTSIITRYKTEGDYCVTLRDATWSALEEILAEVQAGDRAVPNSFADIEDDLPTVVWPT